MVLEQQFLGRLTENPGDLAIWSVYADFLLSRGDARGELLALDLAGKQAEAKVLREGLVRDWFGSVEVEYEYEEYAYAEGWDWSQPVPTRPKHILELGESHLGMTWWGPFVQELRLRQGKPPEYDDSGYSYQVYDAPKWEQVWPQVLQSPACRLLQSLHVEVGEDREWASIVGLLPRSIRSLHLGSDDPQWVLANHIPDLSSLFTTLPNLESLSVQGGCSRFALSPSAPAPRITELKIRMTHLTPEHIAAITPENFPALEHLSIESLNDGFLESRLAYYPQDADSRRWLEERNRAREGLLDLLKRDFPKVRELKIAMGSGISTLKALQASPMLPRLRWLEVGGCGLEQNLTALVKFRGHWHHIPHIGLEIDAPPKSLVQLQPFVLLPKAEFK